MQNKRNNLLLNLPKYFIGFIGTFIFRLLSPFMGLWNISPLMSTELAGSKSFGPLAGGLYGVLSMVSIDIIMGKVGIWTIITSLTYGLIGILGAFFLNKRSASAKNFVLASIIGTLFFDFVTGILMGPILFHQSWLNALIGQIPFTLRHLAGNIFFAIVLAPWFYRKIIENPQLELNKIFKFA